MNHLNKGKAKYISVWALVLLLLTITLYYSASGFHTSHFHSFLTVDTLPVSKADSQRLKVKIQNDSAAIGKIADTTIINTIDTLTYRPSKDALDAPVVYHADDFSDGNARRCLSFYDCVPDNYSGHFNSP